MVHLNQSVLVAAALSSPVQVAGISPFGRGAACAVDNCLRHSCLVQERATGADIEMGSFVVARPLPLPAPTAAV